MNRQLKDDDYELVEGGAWLTVRGFAIRIHSTDEGLVVDVFDDGKAEREEEYDTALLSSLWLLDNELEEFS